ncbi:DUF1302 family protein, partial [Pseudomonas aeruginosa]
MVDAGVELFDALIYHNSAIGDLPASVRLGNQVRHSGTRTFIPNGISAITPIDVTALHRPGSTIQQDMIPL